MTLVLALHDIYLLIPDNAMSETHQTKHANCFNKLDFCLCCIPEKVERLNDTDLHNFKISFFVLFNCLAELLRPANIPNILVKVSSLLV